MMKRKIEDEQKKNQTHQLEIDRLKKINENYKANREQYRVLIFDITKKVEEKIKELVFENAALKANRR